MDTWVVFIEPASYKTGIGIGPNIDEAEFKRRYDFQDGRKLTL